MKLIPLTRGKFAKVDNADFVWLMQWRWYCLSNGYAVRDETTTPYHKRTILMHRQIMNTPDNMEVDHIDLDRLNNQRENLRNCTSLNNKRNSRKRSDNTSGYKGVSLEKRVRGDLWRAYFMIDRKQIHLGYFKTPEEAAMAYDQAVREQFGEFAKLNFP